MLSPTETEFRAALLDASHPIPLGLADGDGRPAGRRYAVYRNNIAVSLREALETGFPAVRGLIGEENFGNIAGVFLRQQPPSGPLMMHYGAGFPEFLENFPPLQHLGYIGDVARIDLAMRRAYHAADAAGFDPAVLQGLEEAQLDRARLRLAPATQLLRSRWPALSIWRYTLRPDQPKPQARPEDVLITRPEFDPDAHLLPPGGGAFVEALTQNAPFGAALAAAGDGFDLPATLGLLLQTSALCALDLEGEG